jgi:hypothetical protein
MRLSISTDVHKCGDSAFGAQRLFSRPSRVRGLGSIFWPPIFSLVALFTKIKALPLPSDADSLLSTVLVVPDFS